MEDVDLEETGSGIPRVYPDEATRPLEQAHRRSGPDFRDIVRLESGEIEGLCLAERYRLGRPLGRGGIAIVFAGEHLDLGQPVAVKILAERQTDRWQAMSRFLREARLGARICHPNVVRIFDYGSTSQGLVYLVMELLQGEDLRAAIARHGGLPWARVRAAMLQICDGLAAVHDAGIVHQDLKPENCFCVLEGGHQQIKLIDFGVATKLGDPDEGSHSIVGTPKYMSPEQALGRPVDARSDVYSAGILLCELLTGHVPFDGAPIAVLIRQVDEPPPTLQQLAPAGLRIDPQIQRIFERAVAKDPDQRFGSIRELAAAIGAVGVEASAELEGALEPGCWAH